MIEQELYAAVLKAFKARDAATYGALLRTYDSTLSVSFADKFWRQLVQTYFDTHPTVSGSAALAIPRLNERLANNTVVIKVYRSPAGSLKIRVRTNGRLQTWTWIGPGHWTK